MTTFKKVEKSQYEKAEIYENKSFVIFHLGGII